MEELKNGSVNQVHEVKRSARERNLQDLMHPKESAGREESSIADSKANEPLSLPSPLFPRDSSVGQLIFE